MTAKGSHPPSADHTPTEGSHLTSLVQISVVASGVCRVVTVDSLKAAYVKSNEAAAAPERSHAVALFYPVIACHSGSS